MNREDYASKLNEIGSRKLDGLTVAEAAGLLREYSRCEKLAASEPATPPAPEPVRYEASVQTPHKKPVRRLDEAAVGRYVMTAAAAALCLLGTAVFAAGFWSGLPGLAKYAVLLLAGLGLWTLGGRKSSGAMRPFWLGVSGLGSGVVFLSIILGHSNWDLYGMLVTGVLCMGWTGACFLMGQKAQSWLFYVIAYVGGWLSFQLACETAYSTAAEVRCGVVAVCVLTMGAAAWRANKKHWIMAAFWMAACWAMGSMLSDIKYIAADGPMWIRVGHYFCAPLACGAAWFLPKAVPELKNHRRLECLAMTAGAFANALFIKNMAGALFNYGNRSADVLAAVILLSGAFIAKPGYLLGISIPLVSLAAGPADGPGVLAASVLALAACLASCRFDEKVDRLGLFVTWCASTHAVLDGASFAPPGHRETFLAAWLILTAGLAAWCWLRCQNGDWSAGSLSWLCVLSGFLYALMIPFEAYGLPDYIMMCLAALSYNAFRRFLMPPTAGRTNTVVKAGTALLCMMTACAVTTKCVFLGAFGMAVPKGEPLVLTATLFLLAALDAYGMVRSQYRLQGALACLSANWCLWMSSLVWTQEARTTVSAIGILVSACFVAAGFRLNQKYARLAGLACALLYALKLGLYDASLSGGMGVSAGLLISGAGCFCISLLYNRLDKAMSHNNGQDI